MGSKKLIFGSAAIVLVVAIIIIVEKMSAVKPPEHKTLLFPGLNERSITAIEISDSPQEAALLEKRGGAWFVSKPSVKADSSRNDVNTDDLAVLQNDVDTAISDVNTESNTNAETEADSASIHVAIEKILSMKRADLASDNPANQEAFGVDTASARAVKIYTDENRDAPAHILLIGKSGPSWSSNYVRLLGSDAVYLIPGGIKLALFPDTEQWKKKVPEEPEILDDEATAIED